MAVDALLYELRKKGLALILPKDVAEAHGVHLQNNSWAPKKGKPCGRNVVNTSGVSAPWKGIPLNTKRVKEAAAQRWGGHPSPYSSRDRANGVGRRGQVGKGRGSALEDGRGGAVYVGVDAAGGLPPTGM